MLDTSKIYTSKNCGKFKVINYIGWDNVEIEFINTGAVKKVCAANINKGSVKDDMHPSVVGVGFLGVGPYKARGDGVAREAYTAWSGMLRRCYSHEFIKKYPTYSGCSVVVEWHNFQVFAEWYFSNHPTDGKDYHLDKDIKVKGNKIYSPETCLFVSLEDNVSHAHAKSYEIVSPLGVVIDVYNMSEFCKTNNLNSGCMSMVTQGKSRSHKGWRLYYTDDYRAIEAEYKEKLKALADC